MKRITTLTLHLLAALAMSAALTFGTAQLLAADGGCPDNGWDQLGSCVDDRECEQKCDKVHGPNGYIQADCFGGCCTCIL